MCQSPVTHLVALRGHFLALGLELAEAVAAWKLAQRVRLRDLVARSHATLMPDNHPGQHVHDLADEPGARLRLRA